MRYIFQGLGVCSMLLVGCASGPTFEGKFIAAMGQGDSATMQRVLQEHKIDPDAQKSWAVGLFKSAVYEHNPAAVQLLLEHGANVNAALDGDGETALQWVASRHQWVPSYPQDIQIAKLLLKHGADVNVRNRNGLTAMHFVRSLELLELLLAKGASIDAKTNLGNTPLHSQITAYPAYDVVKYLIDHTADINSIGYEGNSPLHVAAWQGDTVLVTYLIEKGANKNSVNHESKTPLHIAIQQKAFKAALVLISNGADLNRGDSVRFTPLHYAQELSARGETGASGVVRALLDKGADPNARSVSGNTPDMLGASVRADLAEARDRADYDRRMVEARKRTQEAGRAATEAYLARQNRQEASSNSQTDQLNDMRKRDDARRSRDAAGAVQQRNQESKRCYSAGNAICP